MWMEGILVIETSHCRHRACCLTDSSRLVDVGDGLYSVDGILQFGVRRVMDNPLYLPLKVRLTDKSSTVHIEVI